MNKKEFRHLVRDTIIDVNIIPKQTPYCYSIDREVLRNRPPTEIGEIPIKTCPYFVFGKGDARGCIYTKFYGLDLLLFDQCKICDH